MRTPLALAVAAALAVPAAAHALPPTQPTPPTDCARVLVNANTGEYTGCDTLGGLNVPGGVPARNLRLTVLAGAATATLTCGGDPVLSATVVLDGPGTASRTVVADSYCWVTATATQPGTTAVVSNTSTTLFY